METPLDKKGRKRKKAKERKPSLLQRVRDHLLCGSSQSYDLVKAEERLQSRVTNTNPGRRTILDFTEDELFYVALFKEGLLKKKITIKNYIYGNYRITRVNLKNNYPVLDICRGFYDHELITGRPARGAVVSTADFRYSPTEDPNPWVQTGLDKVMYEVRSHRKEMRFRGLRVSTWLDILEPALPSLLLIRKMGRIRRSNISKCKPPSPLHLNRTVTIGDVGNEVNMFGPNPGHDEDDGFIAMFAEQLFELSQWRWLREIRFLPQFDRNIGNLWEVRESTRNQPSDRDHDEYKETRRVNARGSKSLSCIDIDFSQIPESTHRPPVNHVPNPPRERTRLQIIDRNRYFV